MLITISPRLFCLKKTIYISQFMTFLIKFLNILSIKITGNFVFSFLQILYFYSDKSIFKQPFSKVRNFCKRCIIMRADLTKIYYIIWFLNYFWYFKMCKLYLWKVYTFKYKININTCTSILYVSSTAFFLNY